jgi:hypothetical protein
MCLRSGCEKTRTRPKIALVRTYHLKDSCLLLLRLCLRPFEVPRAVPLITLKTLAFKGHPVDFLRKYESTLMSITVEYGNWSNAWKV